MILLNPPFRDFKDVTVEPIIIPQDKLQELKTLLENPKVH